MRAIRRPAFWPCPALLAASIAMTPNSAAAQEERTDTWAIVPSMGFGMVRVGESRNSAGMELAVDVEYGGAAWRADAFASLRGLGVGCSHSCFDGGPALAAGVSRSLGRVRLGGGMGTMNQLGDWFLLPYGRISVNAAALRFNLRVEFPQDDSGVYFPLLIGIPLPRGGR